MTVTLTDLDRWSLDDLVDAHSVLDALEEAESRAAEEARNSRGP